LWAAGSTDLIATEFSVSFEGVIWSLRALAVAGPVIAYVLARQVCLALQAADRERRQHGAPSGRIERSPSGGYHEVHHPLTPQQVQRMAAIERPVEKVGTPAGGGSGASRQG
jgi:ubiquinol-cytochrome c reductase cytochrome b subunit